MWSQGSGDLSQARYVNEHTTDHDPPSPAFDQSAPMYRRAAGKPPARDHMTSLTCLSAAPPIPLKEKNLLAFGPASMSDGVDDESSRIPELLAVVGRAVLPKRFRYIV
jgi:hypothetical protein